MRLVQTEIRTHMSGSRKLDLAAVAVAVLAGVLLVPSAASASDQVAPTMGLVGAAALQAATRPATAISAKAQPQLKSRVNAHVDKLARVGQLTDTAEVQVATVPDPTNADAQVQLVWDEGKVPEKVYTASVAGKFAGFGSVFKDSDATADKATTDATAQNATPPASSGFDAASAKKNMYKYRFGSAEQWWEPKASSIPDHYLWTGWEKWAESGTDHWIYNRWARFSRANQNGGATPETREFTIRSRPWDYETNTDVTRLNSATPVASVTKCSEVAKVDFGYERSGISGKVSVPIHRCDDTHPVGTMGRKEIGVQFLGKTKDVVRYLDAAGDYTAKNKTVVPSWADYSWVTTAEDNTELPVLFEQDYIRKDSGW